MKLKLAAFALASLALALPAHARKDTVKIPVAAITAHKDYAGKIGDFKFVWGGKASGAQLGTSTTRKATNAVGKSQTEACVWAALSALIAMKADAIQRGGTSVQAITSKVSEEDFSSATEFDCISGFTNARVYFEGVVVK
jgi:hypothetical protein